MKDLSSYLISIGLTDTESKLYIKGLKKPLSFDALISGTSIKPSTAYHALSTLRDKGLTATSSQDGKQIHTMLGADYLSLYLTSRSRKLEQQQIQLDQIRGIFPTPTELDSANFNVEHFDSIDGVKKVIDAALDCTSCEWQIIAPKRNFLSEYDKSYAKYFMAKRQARHIRSQTLWESPPTGRGSAHLTLQGILARNPRYLPPKYRGQFDSLIIIFDDQIAYISSLKSTEAVLIKSASLSSTMRIMFDALWHASRDILK